MYCITCDYSCGRKAVVAVIRCLANDESVMIDFDIGPLMPGRAVVALLSGNPEWDWLTEMRDH